MNSRELSQIRAREFYVLLKGLPSNEGFWYLCRHTPKEMSSLSEIERITEMAKR